MGCRLEKARDWAVRITHEASLHEENCFITLTYDDDHLPLELGYEDFQKFIRRLRKKTNAKIRFYMCAEYGEATHRPHYHAILFGYQFPDRTKWTERRGHQTFRSALLESVWRYGHSEIGTVSPQSAAYCARYIIKKQNPYNPDGSPVVATSIIDPTTGEIRPRHPEFTKMSLKPGIAHDWIHKYMDDVFPEDRVVFRGKTMPAPAYYRNELEKVNPELAEELRQKRVEKARENVDNTEERLEVKEKVAVLKNERYKREPQP